jgi:hypothetical protein
MFSKFITTCAAAIIMALTLTSPALTDTTEAKDIVVLSQYPTDVSPQLADFKYPLQASYESDSEYQLTREDEVDLLLAGEFAAKNFTDPLAEEATTEPAWQRPSAADAATWCKAALKRLVDARGKIMLASVAAGTATIGLGALLMNLANPDSTANFYELTQLLPQHLLYNLPKCAAINFFLTFCHEAGHALASYYVSGKPTAIHLGASSINSAVQPLEILPHVKLCELDPAEGGYVIDTLPKTISIKNEFQIKKAILLEMAQNHPQTPLQELKDSDEYNQKVNVALDRKMHYDRGVFCLAGPASGLCANALLKAATGSSLLVPDSQDCTQLIQLYPTNAPAPSDGGAFCNKALERPDITNTADRIKPKLFGLLAGLFVIKEYIGIGISNHFPPTGMADIMAIAGQTLRLLGAGFVNFGCFGFTSITKVLPQAALSMPQDIEFLMQGLNSTIAMHL